jgi:hypothetical protein
LRFEKFNIFLFGLIANTGNEGGQKRSVDLIHDYTAVFDIVAQKCSELDPFKPVHNVRVTVLLD